MTHRPNFHRSLDQLNRAERLHAGQMILDHVSAEIIGRVLRISALQAKRLIETYYLGYGQRPYGPTGRCPRCGCTVVLPCKCCHDLDIIQRKRSFEYGHQYT
jgi:hypothetical protein